MKRLISILVSISILLITSIPVLAVSSQSGFDSDITSLKFDASSYTIKQGEVFDMNQHLVALAGTSQLVQEPIATWSLQNDNNFAFGIDQSTGIIDVIEPRGTATITVTANNGKVKATTKVVAVAAKRDSVEATGFAFEKSTFTILTGAQVESGSGDRITIIPSPSDAYFTSDQTNAITSVAVNGLTIKGQPDLVPSVEIANDKKIVLVYPLKSLYDNKNPIKSTSINFGPVAFPTSNGRTVNINRSIRIDSKNAVQANAIYGLENKSIKVGEKVLVDGLFKQGPSSHNITRTPEYNLDYIDNNSQVLDYADIIMIPDDNGDEKFYIQGVKVGKNKLTATINGNRTAQIIINVIASDASNPTPPTTDNNGNPTVTNSTANIIVDQTLTLNVKDVPTGKVPTWKTSDTTMGTLSTSSGNPIVFKASRAGTVVVTAMIDGVDVSRTTINITGSRPGTTSNPQTSDKLMSNLW